MHVSMLSDCRPPSDVSTAHVRGEGLQNLPCAAQAGAVLLGLVLTAAFGWWWTNAIVGLALAAIAVRGRGAWRGNDCC